MPLSQMAVDLTLTINHGYDRVRPIETGEVSVEGVNLDFAHVPPGPLFTQIAEHPDAYEVTEQSLSTHVLWTAKEENPFIGIPVFPSRFFRHSGIYLPEDSGIEHPTDLVGKTVGAFITYQETAVVMMRGMLEDEYGVAPSDVSWVLQSKERVPFDYPDDVDVTVTEPAQSVLRMIETGELDALLSPRAPAALGDGVKRLFEDYKDIEQAYFRDTGVFPIMHLICIHRDVYEEQPWIATSLWDAFVEAKEKSIARLTGGGGLSATLPWLYDHVEETRTVLGEDYWPYGFRNEINQKTLDTICRYSYEHGLSGRRVQPHELFAEEFTAR